jgi:hypothetical protein
MSDKAGRIECRRRLVERVQVIAETGVSVVIDAADQI